MNNITQLDYFDWPEAYPYIAPNLIYIDPPFFTQRDFGSYDDRWKGKDYSDFLRKVINTSYQIIAESGNFLLHLDWRASHIARFIGDLVFGESNFQNDIIWKYNSGGASPKRLARKHDTILWWTAGNNYTFNVQREPYPHDYGDRAGFHPEGKMLSDVWEVPRLSNTAIERTGYPTEKPPALLERIVTIFSNKGQLVLDPMCGSGTTLVAAKKLGRAFMGSDIGTEAVSIASRRLGP